VQLKKTEESIQAILCDIPQLDQMLSNCPSVCLYKNKPPRKFLARINGYCGIWYKVDDQKSKEARLLQACEAKTLINGRKTVKFSEFSTGILPDAFMSMFAGCHIGVITNIQKSETFVSFLTEMQHIIFDVRQTGKWTR
jgi:hypothetical protein